MPVVEPRDPLDKDPKGTNLKLGKLLRQELEAIAKANDLTLTETINQMLKWAIRQHRADEGKEPKASKK